MTSFEAPPDYADLQHDTKSIQRCEEGSDTPARKRSLAKLYLLCASLFMPALPTAIIYTALVSVHPLVPGLGLIPMGFGMLFALARAISLRHGLQTVSRRRTTPSPIRPLDWKVESAINFVIALGLFATWATAMAIALTTSYEGADGTLAWLGAYATVPMLFAMILHLILAWKTSVSRLQSCGLGLCRLSRRDELRREVHGDDNKDSIARAAMMPPDQQQLPTSESAR